MKQAKIDREEAEESKGTRREISVEDFLESRFMSDEEGSKYSKHSESAKNDPSDSNALSNDEDAAYSFSDKQEETGV